jgi:type I restriction enzyme S subunit
MPEEIRAVPLDSLVSDKISYGIIQPGNLEADGVPIVRVKDVRNGKIDTSDPLVVSREVEQKYARTRLRGGEVLLTLVGSVGEVAVASEEVRGWNVARAIAVVRPSSEVTAQWLRLVLSSSAAQRYFSDRLNTTVQATLNLKDVRTLPVPMPSPRGRDAVCAVVGALDDKIAVNERIATVARSLAVNIGKRQISQIRGELASLGDYVSLVKGNSYKSADVGHGAQRLVSLKSIGRDGSYRPSGLKRFAGDFKPQQRLESGEVVVAHTDLTQRAEVLARPVRVPEVGPEVHVASLDLAIVRPSRLLTNEYLLALLSREDFRNHALGFSNGTTVLHLSVKAVPSYEFVPPGEDLVDRVTAEMRPLLKRADASEKESETLSVLRDTLLPQLMSGRLRVKDAEKIVEDHV